MAARWYVQVMGEAQGPFTGAQLRVKAQRGEISPDSLLRRGEDSDWVSAFRVKRLFDPPASPPALADRKPVPIRRPPDKSKREVTGSKAPVSRPHALFMVSRTWLAAVGAIFALACMTIAITSQAVRSSGEPVSASTAASANPAPSVVVTPQVDTIPASSAASSGVAPSPSAPAPAVTELPNDALSVGHSSGGSVDASMLLGELTIGQWFDLPQGDRDKVAAEFLEAAEKEGLLTVEWQEVLSEPGGSEKSLFRVKTYFGFYPIMASTTPDIPMEQADAFLMAEVMIPALQAEGMLLPSPSLAAIPAASRPAGKVPSIEFEENTWHFHSDRPQRSSAWRSFMESREYRCDARHGFRLLEQYLSEDSPEGVYKRRLQVEQLVGGRWRRHGRSENWLQSAGGDLGDTSCDHEVSHCRNGEAHGPRIGWYANGQKCIEETYVDNVLQGVSRGWYRNGSPRYEATYLDGKELPGGRSWKPDGTAF